MKCPSCKRNYTNPIEIDFIRRAGVCLDCDKLRGEAELELIQIDTENSY